MKTKQKNRQRKKLNNLFGKGELFISILFVFSIHFVFFNFVSDNKWFGLAAGVAGTAYFVRFIIIPNKRLKRYQFQLNELLKYVTNMTFFMQTGENVLQALETTAKTVDPEIRKDILKTIETLESDAALVTDHFEKYDFPTLNQFHRNLLIKYENGGDPVDLFGQIKKNMLFELKKRDELHRSRKGFALNVYVLLGMVMGMMLMLRMIIPQLWDIFLSFNVASLFVISSTYALILCNLFGLQKHNQDISVRL